MITDEIHDQVLIMIYKILIDKYSSFDDIAIHTNLTDSQFNICKSSFLGVDNQQNRTPVSHLGWTIVA